MKSKPRKKPVIIVKNVKCSFARNALKVFRPRVRSEHHWLKLRNFHKHFYRFFDVSFLSIKFDQCDKRFYFWISFRNIIIHILCQFQVVLTIFEPQVEKLISFFKKISTIFKFSRKLWCYQVIFRTNFVSISNAEFNKLSSDIYFYILSIHP